MLLVVSDLPAASPRKWVHPGHREPPRHGEHPRHRGRVRHEVGALERRGAGRYTALLACALVALLSLLSEGLPAQEIQAGPGPGMPVRIQAGGGLLDLRSDPGRVAVLRSRDGEPARWEMLRLGAVVRDVEDLKSRLGDLRESGEAEFASPVFVTEDGGWFVPTQHILMRVHPQHVSAIGDILRSQPGGLRVVDRNFGRMAGAFRLASTSRHGLDVMQLALRLAQDERVKWAEANTWFSGRKQHVPNDPLFPNTWGIRQVVSGSRLHDMVGDVAWEETTGDSTIQVLVLDDGVDATHPDIAHNGGRDFTDGPAGSPPGDIANGCDRHGTEVAGCITGIIDNGIGTGGIAPGCRVLSARVYESDLTQPCGQSWNAYADSLISAIAWGLDGGARISNNSNRHNSNLQTQGISDAYENAYDHGMVHFGAAGNSGAHSIDYPARLQWVNAVGRINSDGVRVSSNYGNAIAFMAPGWGVWTTDLVGIPGDNDTGDYVSVDGTSFASPYAAGVAALLLSQRPQLNPREVEWILQCTARDLGTPGWDDRHGWGLVNANSALQFPVRRVSVDGNRQEADIFSGFPALTDDGRFVVFESNATNLISGDTNGLKDIFIHDRHTAETHRVSVTRGGAMQSTADSDQPDISGDGLWAVFATTARLDNSDNNGLSDIYLFERDPDADGIYDELGQCDAFTCQFRVIWISKDTGGGPPDGDSHSPSISADGRYIAFASAATDLVPNDTNGVQDVFVYDHTTGGISRASVSTSGAQADADCFQPDISADGNHVSFQSASSTLVTGVGFGVGHIYVRDLQGGTTAIVSVDGSGVPGNGSSSTPSLSTTGRWVSFASAASNLVGGDTNGVQDVFRHDRDKGGDGTYDQAGDIETVRVSKTTQNQEGNNDSFEPHISGSGRYVVFNSYADNLVGNDTNGTADIFARDLQPAMPGAVALRRLSVDRDFNQSNGSSSAPVISGDGVHVAYMSYATNLVSGDTNGSRDIFLHQCATPFSDVIISLDPQDGTYVEGDQVTLTVAASSSPPPRYQWRKDGEEIAGAIMPAYTIPSAQVSDAGMYDCLVNNGISSVVSNPATITVGPPTPACTVHRDDDDTRESEATMDYTDDFLEKTLIVPGAPMSSSPVRLWIFGQPYNYAGQSFQPREDYQLTVNGSAAQRINFDVGLLFDYDDSTYAWRSIDVPWDWIQPGANTFHLIETGPFGSWDHNNLRIGVDTDNDFDRSWWYGNGVFTCNNNPAACTGELMIYLEICDPAVDAPPQPALTRIDRLLSYPNPFNPSTTIRLELSRPGRVRISIYDLRGKRVRQLVSERLPEGIHRFSWMGRDERGERVASGIYAIRAQTPQGVLRQKIVLLK